MAAPVISARTVQGSAVRNARNEELGHIEDLVIDKVSGRIVYAVLSFGGFLGIGDKHFALPWEALRYSKEHEAYLLDIDPDTLRRAPGFDKSSPPDMSDQRWGREIHEHFGYRAPWDRDGPGSGASGTGAATLP